MYVILFPKIIKQQLVSTLIKIGNVLSPNQHIVMISEGPCDTESLSNGAAAKNTALSSKINYNLAD